MREYILPNYENARIKIYTRSQDEFLKTVRRLRLKPVFLTYDGKDTRTEWEQITYTVNERVTIYVISPIIEKAI